MAVDVDEAGRDVQAAGVEARHVFRGRDGPDVDDAAVLDRHVGGERRATGAVEHCTAGDEQIDVHGMKFVYFCGISFAESQSFTVPSSWALARVLPSGLNAME